MRVILGSAQLGCVAYGVTNQNGVLSYSELKKILSILPQYNINSVDTAPVYQSEKRLGICINEGKYDFTFLSKTPSFDDVEAITQKEVDLTEQTLLRSLETLGVHSLEVLSVHNSHGLLKPGAKLLYRALQKWKEQGLIKNIGATVYKASEIKRLLNYTDVKVIQAPVNLFDQRLLMDGTLETMKKHGVTVHARSIFMQGILLKPQSFQHSQAIAKYKNWLIENQLNPLEACLKFATQQPFIDAIIIGVSMVAELQEIMEVLQKVTKSSNNSYPWDSIAQKDEKLLNPMKWD